MIRRPKNCIPRSGFGSTAYYAQCAGGLRTKFRPLSDRSPRKSGILATGKRIVVDDIENCAFAAGLSDKAKSELVKLLDEAIDRAAPDGEILDLGQSFIEKHMKPREVA